MSHYWSKFLFHCTKHIIFLKDSIYISPDEYIVPNEVVIESFEIPVIIDDVYLIHLYTSINALGKH